MNGDSNLALYRTVYFPGTQARTLRVAEFFERALIPGTLRGGDTQGHTAWKDTVWKMTRKDTAWRIVRDTAWKDSEGHCMEDSEGHCMEG